MTNEEKITMVKAMTDETNDEVISAFITFAGNKICRLAYPYDDSITEVPSKYETIQVEAAAYMLNKRGGEGELSHAENGITRTYEDGDFPRSMLRMITPVAGVSG